MKWNIPGTSEVKFDPDRWAQMQADSANAADGDLTGYDCPRCRNRGYSMAVREDRSLVAVVCECMVMRKCLQKMAASGLGDALERLTFDAFRVEDDWQKTLLEKARAFAANPKGWMYLSGQPGCGKTHLCTAVCRELLLKGRQVRYLSWREEVSSLKFRDGEARAAFLKELKAVPVLYIDDLFKTGAEKPTAAEVGIAFELLNARYVSRLTTILSSECGLNELIAIDEAVASRIAEMSRDCNMHIRRDMKRNYRLRGM